MKTKYKTRRNIMSTNHTIPEPYASHLKELRGQMNQLEAQRDKSLALVYRIEHDLASMTKHLQSLLMLQKQEHKLPDETLDLTADLRLVSSPEQKVNGMAH